MSVAVNSSLLCVCIFLFVSKADAEGAGCLSNGRSVSEGALTHGDDPCHVCICRQGRLECYWQQCGPAPQFCQVFDVDGRCNPSLYLCEIPKELVEAKDQLINAWPFENTISSKRLGRSRSRVNRFDLLPKSTRKLRRGSSRRFLPTGKINPTRKSLNLSPLTKPDKSQAIYFSEVNSAPGDFNSYLVSNSLTKARKTHQFSSKGRNASPSDSKLVQTTDNSIPSLISNTNTKRLTGTGRSQIFLRRPSSNLSRPGNSLGFEGEYGKESIDVRPNLKKNGQAVHIQEYFEGSKISGGSSQQGSKHIHQFSSQILPVDTELSQASTFHLTPITNFDYDIDEDIDLSEFTFPEFGRRLRRSVPDSRVFDLDLVKHLDSTRKRRVARSTVGDRFQRMGVEENGSCRLLGVTYQIGEVIGVASDHCMQCRCASQAMFCSPRCCFFNIRERAFVQDPVGARGPASAPRRHPLHQYLKLAPAQVM